ncbi:MAG TPA: GerMN domain-containing protein [Mobilitalea sp.]|nr:GerMN domain-containing protein [Mobilitalea sp.]
MKKRIGLFILLILMILLAGCDGNKNNNVKDRGSVYKIYYIDNKTSKLVSENYTAVGTTKEQLVNELLSALRKDPKNIIYKKALPDNVTIKSSKIEKDQLTIDFDSSYSDLTGIPEILSRATIVKTLIQIKGLEYIEFLVNGQQLMDNSGALVGLMTADTFIDSTGEETSYPVTLYFANKEGNALIAQTTNIYITGNISIEELVIKQLINGPTQIGMYETIPKDTTLLDVTTKEGICYVDFNEKFLDKISNIKDDVAIYSIVNSLVDLPNINKVQFLINGSVQKTYRDNTPFDSFFERNLAIIVGSK